MRDAENGYPLDLFDLIHENPKQFKRIIQETIDIVDSYGYDLIAVKQRKAELAHITALQWEVVQSTLPPTKATLFDKAVAKIKGELFWANIEPSDSAPVVFWQDVFDPFVSFIRRRGKTKMSEVLAVTSDELKEAGFTPDFIDKIITALNEWADRLLNPDTSVAKEVKEAVDEDVKADEDTVAHDVLSFFFNNDNEEGDEVENNDE